MTNTYFESAPPEDDRDERLARVTTGFAVRVAVPDDMPGAPEHEIVVDEPISNMIELREAILRRFPEASEYLAGRVLSVAVNGEMRNHGDKTAVVKDGDRVTFNV